MIKIIRPGENVATKIPGIFLAGPIQGTNNWQNKAILMLSSLETKLDSDYFVASPRSLSWQSGYDFESQVDWESEYLQRAGQTGVIMFWLANETEHFCERAYAQTTRFELAEWLTKSSSDGVAVVVGFDTKFSGSKYIKHRLLRSFQHVKTANTLDETILLTAELFLNKNKAV